MKFQPLELLFPEGLNQGREHENEGGDPMTAFGSF